MLQVETHTNLRNPRKYPASRVLVRDELGNPIAVVFEYQGQPITATLRDPDFAHIMREFGIAAAVVEPLELKRLEDSPLAVFERP